MVAQRLNHYAKTAYIIWEMCGNSTRQLAVTICLDNLSHKLFVGIWCSDLQKKLGLEFAVAIAVGFLYM